MKVKTFNKIAVEGLNVIQDRIPNAKCSSEMASPDAIILRSYKLQLEECAEVIAVARAGAGVNNVPVQELTERGVIVFNTPGANANAVAEITIGAMIADARNMYAANAYFTGVDGSDPGLAERVERQKKQFKGSELKGKKIVVFGLGAIGSAVVKLALAFGMQVVGEDPYASLTGLQVVEEWDKWDADYYTFHVPATVETKKIAARALEVAQKDNATLLNFSRGELFNNEILGKALDGGLKHYITDFAHEDFAHHSKAICYPHLGASTAEAETNCSLMAAHQLCDLWQYGVVKNSVNFPAMPLMDQDQGTERLLFLHRNEPGLLKGITSRIADLGLNVNDMANRARYEYAATLADISGPTEKVAALQVQPISGVLRVFKVPGCSL